MLHLLKIRLRGSHSIFKDKQVLRVKLLTASLATSQRDNPGISLVSQRPLETQIILRHYSVSLPLHLISYLQENYP